MAVEQKRLRTQAATAGDKSELQTHIMVQETGGGIGTEHPEMKHKQYLHPKGPSLLESQEIFNVKSSKIFTGLSEQSREIHKQARLSQTSEFKRSQKQNIKFFYVWYKKTKKGLQSYGTRITN